MTEILVVDDDVALGSSYCLVLERQGYNVSHAIDGQHAQRAFVDHPADVVLTDIVMPELDGLELISWIRQASSQTRIIAMSGDARAHAGCYLAIAKRFGADRVLEKPFSPTELLAVVRELAGAQGDTAAVELGERISR